MSFAVDFADELDSVVTVGRPSWDDADASETRAPRTVAVVASDVRLRIYSPRGDVESLPHGHLERVTHQAIGPPDVDVQERDLVRADEGPEAGKYFEVGPVYEPLSDHVEMTMALRPDEADRAGDEPWQP